ncbi:MAG: hypothetical protein HYY06_04225 [Deltaproteobacteria bacterium]|nr:hypothetical protein [Deltaproteobacteria bacterium]
MKRRGPRSPVQLELRPRTHGGRREGAGRPKTGNAGVPHRSREALASRFPVHVTLRARRDAPDLRTSRSLDGHAREAVGVLLYAAAGQHLDLRYRLAGHDVMVRTLDLDQPWTSIRASLLDLVADLSSSGPSVRALS